MKLLPVMVTGVPPAVEPVVALRPVTTGAGDWKANLSLADVIDVPAVLATVTSITPAISGGVTAVIDVLTN